MPALPEPPPPLEYSLSASLPTESPLSTVAPRVESSDPVFRRLERLGFAPSTPAAAAGAAKPRGLTRPLACDAADEATGERVSSAVPITPRASCSEGDVTGGAVASAHRSGMSSGLGCGASAGMVSGASSGEASGVRLCAHADEVSSTAAAALEPPPMQTCSSPPVSLWASSDRSKRLVSEPPSDRAPADASGARHAGVRTLRVHSASNSATRPIEPRPPLAPSAQVVGAP